jgi:hypothetical protein
MRSTAEHDTRLSRYSTHVLDNKDYPHIVFQGEYGYHTSRMVSLTNGNSVLALGNVTLQNWLLIQNIKIVLEQMVLSVSGWKTPLG